MSEYDYCAPRTFFTAEQALERIYQDRFFLMVDTWDPHEPWDPPEWYARQYLPDYDGRVVPPPYNYYQQAGLTDADLATARGCYAAECTMVDRWVGRLLERLESLGVADCLEWTGFSRDVPGELARMDLLVFPSVLAEGLPMVLLEAMAAGVPIVASRVDGVVEVIDDGRQGLLVPPGDPAALAAAIERVIRDDADVPALRAAAWLRQRVEFSDRTMAEGVAAVYREVLGR